MYPFGTEEEIRAALAGESDMSLGLEQMACLCGRLGDPQDAIPTVHIAGTNGKGSVAAYVSSALSACGYRTGRYTSPAVFDPRETVTVDGLPADSSLMVDSMNRVYAAAEFTSRETGKRPTRFELETAAAFECFRAARCRIAVVETGLGGRLDATNVIRRPEVAVLTSISLDHTRILGASPERIAEEKSGIIKPGCAVVCAPAKEEAARVVTAAAARYGIVPVFCEEGERTAEGIRYRGTTYRTAMAGSCQACNLPVAAETLHALALRGYDVGNASEGIARAVCPGRFEIMQGDPVVVLDGAHNPAAAASLRKSLLRVFPDRKRVCAVGIFRDKDIRGIAEAIADVFDTVIAFDWRHPRAQSAVRTAQEFRLAGARDVRISDTVRAAVVSAKTVAGSGGCVTAFGSLSHLKEARDAARGEGL